jgi:cob(II)yrinic acid a,c-diamide reductase
MRRNRLWPLPADPPHRWPAMLVRRADDPILRLRHRAGQHLLKKNSVEPRHYRDAMAQFAGAVHVVTTDGAAGRRGVTVIAACSVSDDPPMILVCLNRIRPDNDCFAENGVFALNTLAASQKPVADAFSGLGGLSQEERFAKGEWETISTGAPVLAGALASFDCTLVEARDMATHRVLFGKVTGLRIGDSVAPLIYHRRAYILP